MTTPGRYARSRRRDPRGAEVTLRDLVLLDAIGRLGALTTGHAAAFLEMSVPMVRRRVRALRDLGLLNVLVPKIDGPNWVLLTDLGAQELSRAFDRDPDEFHRLRDLPFYRDHHAEAASVYLAFVAACARSRQVRLEEICFDLALKRRQRGEGKLVPDIALRMTTPSGEAFAALIEVDRGTESPRQVVSDKMTRYQLAYSRDDMALGAASWAVFFVTPTVRRWHRLAQAFVDAEVRAPVCFARTDQVTPRGVLGRIWWKIDEDGERLRPVETAFPACADRDGSGADSSDGGDHGWDAEDQASGADHLASLIAGNPHLRGSSSS